MQTEALGGGFANPAVEAAHTFRGVMEAIARPGTIHTLAGAQPPAPLSPAAGAADCEAVRTWIAFHTGASLCGPENAMFVLGSWQAFQPLDRFPVGTPEYPDRSATLIVEMSDLDARGATLKGPGIRDTAALPLPDPAAFRANAARFPLGLDFILTCGSRVTALPRSTR